MNLIVSVVIVKLVKKLSYRRDSERRGHYAVQGYSKSLILIESKARMRIHISE